MDDNKIIKKASAGIIGLVLVPAIVKGILIGGAYAVDAIDQLHATIKWKRYIKKGLKDGSIVEINGEYYEVLTDEEA